MEDCEMKNTWVWFLNVTLKMHADVNAASQKN